MTFFKLKTFFLVSFIFCLFNFNNLKSEPLIILEYSTSKDVNKDHKSESVNKILGKHYKIKKNESLSGIVEKFYGNMGLNLSIVQTAVVYHNKHAFVRNNPNFMFANKKIYLPLINDIKNLVYKDKKGTNKEESINNQVSDIYFFGG